MLIGFIGAPSCGKSTTAFGLCYKLKCSGHAVEFIAEYARYQIMQYRAKGIPNSNGGTEGQKNIYAQDSANTEFYRKHADAVCIMDGSTINCHFYGIEEMDFVAEANKYDLLFYIPTTDVPFVADDANRMQDKQQILEMAKRWEVVVRPLMSKVNNIVELRGFPYQTHEEMLNEAMSVIQERFFAKKIAA